MTYRKLACALTTALYIGVAAMLISPYPASAAELQPQLPARLQVGDTVTIPIILDSQGENINAIEGDLHYPPSMSLTDIRDGSSVITFWVERPSKGNGVVHFSGITPGGFTGTGEVFTLVFSIDKSVTEEFSLFQAHALLNNGQGTEVPLTIGKIQTSSLPSNGAESISNDRTPPDTFTPFVSADPNLEGGKQVVIFATQDKGSGIDHYEVAERQGIKAFFLSAPMYTRAESPYVLGDQQLRSYIYVKAVDRSGNERVSLLSPEHLPLYYNLDALAGILIVLLVLCITAWTYVRRSNLTPHA